MSDFERKVSADRRGRLFVDGIFLDFESEVETFKALAAKYLKGGSLAEFSSIEVTSNVADNTLLSASDTALAKNH